MPTVSVVMGVYNGGGTLAATVNSVTMQEGVSLEFVIVDDGSKDGSKDLLEELGRIDSRVRVVHQENTGLTGALVRGCALARGQYIARQDAGDVSLPGRFAKQVRCLAQKSELVMCSTFAEFRGPCDELLYTASVNDEALSERRRYGPRRGPSHHGTVMMRRDVYEAVGGYRRAFYFAQDMDLWSRLTEVGHHRVLPEVLYRARLEPASISGCYAREQRRLAKLIGQAAKERRAGRDDAEILDVARGIKPWRRSDSRLGIAKGAYFIGSCLQRSDPVSARRYFSEAVANDPLHLMAWMKLARLCVDSKG